MVNYNCAKRISGAIQPIDTNEMTPSGPVICLILAQAAYLLWVHKPSGRIDDF